MAAKKIVEKVMSGLRKDLLKDKKMEDEKITDEATFSTEKILTTLIEKLIAKALNEQQKNLLNIATGNSEISKQQIAELKKQNKDKA